MRTRTTLLLIATLLIACGVIIILMPKGSEAPRPPVTVATSTSPTASSSEVTLATPAIGSAITSPIRIEGSAPGTWFSEAVLRVSIQDSSGKMLAEGQGHAKGEWMTEGQVPFVSDISFISTAGDQGFIVIRNDNPSGLPEKEKMVKFPILFN